MSCREVVDLLTEYFEGALPELDRARVEEHLATCPDCIAYTAQMRTTIGLLGRLREDDIPPAVLDQLVKASKGRQAD